MKTFRINIPRYLLDNLFSSISLIWGFLIFVIIAIYLVPAEQQREQINLYVFALFMVLMFLLSVLVVAIYAYLKHFKVVLTITHEELKYNDPHKKVSKLIKLKDIKKVISRTILVGIQDMSKLELTNVTGADVVKDAIIKESAGTVTGSAGELLAYKSSKTGKAINEAIVDKFGGGNHQDWYGRWWVELETIKKKEIIPLYHFDSATREQIILTIKSKINKQ